MLKYTLLLIGVVVVNGSANPYSANSNQNAYGAGSAYSDVNSPYGKYRNPYSDNNPDNPYGQGVPLVPDVNDNNE